MAGRGAVVLAVVTEPSARPAVVQGEPVMPKVAIVHDYLTQRGGAERVVLSMMRAFPDASLHTSLYEPSGTFPEFAAADVHTSPLQRLRPLRRHHRLALPLLATTFSRTLVDADVVLCSSSGWAHGVRTSTGSRKVVYCYAPARWLHQTERYLGHRKVAPLARPLFVPLRRWDHRAAHTADLYITSSSYMRNAIRDAYRIEAEVLPPPNTLDPEGHQHPIAGIEPGFVLAVSRLLPYKNVGAIVDAFTRLSGARLVVAGSGPAGASIAARAGPNVTLVGSVDDDQLRWLYRNSHAVVAAGYEDFGLTPVEGAAFGKPSAVLRFGGYLDTVVDGATGVFFDEPTPEAIAGGLRRVMETSWDTVVIATHAQRYSEARFVERLRGLALTPRAT